MTYLIEKPTESTSVEQPLSNCSNCSNCPKFRDYQDSRGRGWCLLFDEVSFQHHPFTRDCHLERVAEEDIIRPSYNKTDKVKIIDPDTDHTQWNTCIVVAKRFNPYHYRTPESALNQTDWYYQLATLSKDLKSSLSG